MRGVPRGAARARGGARGGALSTIQLRSTLEPILELALQAGRIRGIYGPPGETAALRLYRKLPRGVALQQSAREVSEALSSLQGHTLEGATLTAVGPGAYTLSIATAEGRLSVNSIVRVRASPRWRLGARGDALVLHGVHRPDGPRRARRRCRSVALEKLEGLLGAGAEVTVVAPQILPELDGARRHDRPPRLPQRTTSTGSSSSSPPPRRRGTSRRGRPSGSRGG